MSSETTQIFIDLIARDKASKALAKSAFALSAVGFAAVKFAKESVAAAKEAEDAQLRLTDAYGKFPKLADVSLKSLDDLSLALEKKTVFDHEATQSAEALLAKFNLTGKQIEQLIPLIQDYAAATGQDLSSATLAVGKAFEGNARALKAVGINFKATGDTAKDFATIQQDLSQKVGGFAEKQGKSAAGQAAILANEYKNLQETVGNALLPALTKLVEVVTPIVNAFNDLPKPVQDSALALGAVAAVSLVVIPRLVATKDALIALGLGGKGAAVGLEATATAETLAGDAALALSAKVKGVLAILGGIAAAGAALAAADTQVDHAALNKQSSDQYKKQADAFYAQAAASKTAADKLAYFAYIAKGAGKSTDDLAKLLPGFAKSVGYVATKQDAAASATKGTTSAVNDQASAYDNLMAKLDGLAGRLETSKRGQLAARQAVRDTVTAINDYNKSTVKSGQVSDDTFGKILDGADAAAAAVAGTANKNKALYDSLVSSRNAVKKGSPLWIALNDYIAKLHGIPDAVKTKIELDFAVAGYAKVVAAGNAAHLKALGIKGFATGGTVPGPIGAPQLAVVHGGERVLTVGENKSGATYMTANIYVTSADPNATVRALKDYIRSNSDRALR